jgi:uncharacterized protein YbjT (DUF2867 family)
LSYISVNTEIKEGIEMRILVLGGRGFIGRNIVSALIAKGANIQIGSRFDDNTVNSQVLPLKMENLIKQSDWTDIIQPFDCVINSVGILRERKGERYETIHTQAPAALAAACFAQGKTFIHISAIGLSPNAGSAFIRSKYVGEQRIIASNPNAIIVRPSLLDGEGGYGAKWFRKVAQWPIQFVMKSEGQVAPLQVTDLGEAVANIAFISNVYAMPTIVELGGDKRYAIEDYLLALRATYTTKPALQISMPKWVVRLASHVFDVFSWTPLSFGHFELMQGYNVPKVNALPLLLGRSPAKLDKLRKTNTLPNGVLCNDGGI